MTKYQQRFFNYLSKLEEEEKKYGKQYVDLALKEMWKYWKLYEKDGVKDSMQLAMASAESYTGLPIFVHLN